MRARASVSIVAAIALAGCAAGGGWVKPGADEAATAREYQDCRAMAETAVKPEIGINQDILATRGIDWQRSQTGRIQTEAMHEETRGRAAAIVDSCMKAKGFSRSP